MKKIALLILICALLVLMGCISSRPKLLIPESDQAFPRHQGVSPADFQANMERIGRQELREGEKVRIEYFGLINGQLFKRIYDSCDCKEGTFTFVGWHPKMPQRDLQKLWQPLAAYITTQYQHCKK